MVSSGQDHFNYTYQDWYIKSFEMCNKTAFLEIAKVYGWLVCKKVSFVTSFVEDSTGKLRPEFFLCRLPPQLDAYIQDDVTADHLDSHYGHHYFTL